MKSVFSSDKFIEKKCDNRYKVYMTQNMLWSMVPNMNMGSKEGIMN